MTDRYELSIKLLDAVSAPASKAEAAINRVVQADKALADASNASAHAVSRLGDELAQTGAQAAAGAAGLDRAAAALAKMDRATAGRQRLLGIQSRQRSGGLAAHRATLPPGPGGGGGDDGPTSSMLSRLFAWNKGVGESVESWRTASAAFMSTPFGMLATGLGKVGGVLFDIAHAAFDAATTIGKVGIALGAVAAIAITKKAIEMMAFAESAKTAFAYATGSPEAGETWMDKAVKTAKFLGANVKDSITQFRMLAAQQFDLGKADALVKMGADLAAMTGNAEAAERIMAQIIKIKSQGKMQGDELMVLAENGLNVGLVYEALAVKLGKSRAEITKMQQTGKITADLFNDAVITAVGKMTGSASPGDFAAKMSTTTMAGMWARLSNIPDMVMMRVAKVVDAGPIKASISKISVALDGLEGDGLARFVNIVVSQIPKATDFALGFFEGMKDGFGGLLDKLTGGAGDFAAWGRKSAASVLWFFGKVVDGAKWLVDVVPAAMQKFWASFESSGALESLKTIDFGQLASDFVTIADALGKIAGFAANVLRVPEFSGKYGVDLKSSDVVNKLDAFKAATGTGATGEDLLAQERAARVAYNRENPWQAIKSMFGGAGPSTEDLAKQWWDKRQQSQPQTAPASPSVQTEVHFFDHRTEVKTRASGFGMPAQVTPASGPLPTWW